MQAINVFGFLIPVGNQIIILIIIGNIDVLMQLTPERLQQLRTEAGMTQSELALEVNVSQSYIARLEKGTLDPKLSVANKIVEVLTRRTEVLCGDIMTPNPITVDARDTAASAVRVMQERNFSQLPVMRGTQMVGIVTERDVIRNLQHDMGRLSVQAVMSPESVPFLDASTPVDAVVPMFQTYQAVLVHNQGRLDGIITRSDLLKLT
ncbi:CBS domain-containing protein [Candidatus Thorarchaeota archaeon]|nr:MAG: CBS domain-containing protein [Candidatus Thorarchaeota archaeon]